MNGKDIKSKEKLIKKLAKDKSVNLTVADSDTFQLITDLNVEITEELGMTNLKFQ